MAVAGKTLGWLLTSRAGATLAATIRPEITALGSELIEGVSAIGAKAVGVVPPGQIGNEQPLAMISEIWYSGDLSMVLLTRQSDPRAGETTIRVTNIHRGEPASGLFEIPSGYRLMGERAPGAAPAQAGPRR